MLTPDSIEIEVLSQEGDNGNQYVKGSCILST